MTLLIVNTSYHYLVGLALQLHDKTVSLKSDTSLLEPFKLTKEICIEYSDHKVVIVRR